MEHFQAGVGVALIAFSVAIAVLFVEIIVYHILVMKAKRQGKNPKDVELGDDIQESKKEEHQESVEIKEVKIEEENVVKETKESAETAANDVKEEKVVVKDVEAANERDKEEVRSEKESNGKENLDDLEKILEDIG